MGFMTGVGMGNALAGGFGGAVGFGVREAMRRRRKKRLDEAATPEGTPPPAATGDVTATGPVTLGGRVGERMARRASGRGFFGY